jgi:hypothetical protein
MTIVTTKQQDKQEPIAQVETSWRYHIVFPSSKSYPEIALQTDNLRKSNQLQNHQGQSRYNPVTKKQETQ